MMFKEVISLTRETPEDAPECTLPAALPTILRRGIRAALDGGRGRLRMDPEDLGLLIGRAIDWEVERLASVRAERARRRWIKELLAEADRYVGPGGRGQKPSGEQARAFEAGLSLEEIFNR